MDGSRRPVSTRYKVERRAGDVVAPLRSLLFLLVESARPLARDTLFVDDSAKVKSCAYLGHQTHRPV